MGNKISKTYEMGKEELLQTSSGWQVFPGKHREDANVRVCIFVANNQQDGRADMRREEAKNLQKLRHPNILSVVEALLEEKTCMALVTRPFVGSLRVVVANKVTLLSLEVKTGLGDVLDALEFLHANKLAHNNLTPDAILVTLQGKWLLAGFGCMHGNFRDFQDTRYIQSRSLENPARSDIFSLGLVCLEALKGAPVFPAGVPNRKDEMSRVLANCNLPASSNFAALFRAIFDTSRPATAGELAQHAVLRDPHVLALRFVDSLAEKSETERVEFLRGLKNLLELPSELTERRIIDERLLPQLAASLGLTRNSATWQLTLEIMFPMISNSAIFQTLVWPHLRSLYRAPEIKLDCVLVLVGNLDICARNLEMSEVQNVIGPFLAMCFDFPHEHLLGASLTSLTKIAALMNMQFLSVSVIPKIVSLVLTNFQLRRPALDTLQKLLDFVDKQTLEIAVYTPLEQLETPEILLVVQQYVDTMDLICKKFPINFRTKRLLPKMSTLLAEEGLTCEGFDKVANLCKTLIKDIELHRRKEFTAVAASLRPTAPAPPPPQPVPQAVQAPVSAAARHSAGQLDLDSLFGRQPPTVVTSSDPFADLLGDFRR